VRRLLLLAWLVPVAFFMSLDVSAGEAAAPSNPTSGRWDPLTDKDTLRVKIRRETAPAGPVGPVTITYPKADGRFDLVPRGDRPPTLKQVTRADLLTFLKKHGRRFVAPYLNHHKHKPDYNPEAPGLIAAHLYKHTRDPYFAESARAALRSMRHYMRISAEEYGRPGPKLWPFEVHWHYIWIDQMRESGLFTEKDEPWIREYLLTLSRNAMKGGYNWDAKPWRRGAGHSALAAALARYYAVHRYPDIKEAELFTKYYNLTWNDWWKHRDTVYNDTGYRSLFLTHVFASAHLTGRKDLFTDPEAMKLWKRVLYAMAPCGALPHVGDTNGWGSCIGSYLYVMEHLATGTRDGRFKWTANRIFDYIANHTVDLFDYHGEYGRLLMGVTLAHMVADDTVQPTSPGSASVLLTRKRPLMPTRDPAEGELGHIVFGGVLGERADGRSVRCFMVVGPEEVPAKIAFRSSDRDDSFWAMIELSGRASHNDVAEPTAVSALMDGEAVLTCNQGRPDEEAEFHNVLFAEDLEGRTHKPFKKMAITVPDFHDYEQATYARVRVGDYQGWPLSEERQFLFVRDRFLVLKDVATFTHTWKCRVGPCWQAQQVGPEVGPNWFDTHIKYLFLSGGGVGNGVMRWKQPTRNLLVFHPPQADCKLEMVNRFEQQKWRVMPVRLRYAWEGTAGKGMTKHWTTLLLPHAPDQKATELVAGIKVLADSLKLTALHVKTPDGREDYIVLNDTGRVVTAGPVQTDARQLHLSIAGDKRRVMAEGGTRVKFQGKMIAQGKRIDTEF